MYCTCSALVPNLYLCCAAWVLHWHSGSVLPLYFTVVHYQCCICCTMLVLFWRNVVLWLQVSVLPVLRRREGVKTRSLTDARLLTPLQSLLSKSTSCGPQSSTPHVTRAEGYSSWQSQALMVPHDGVPWWQAMLSFLVYQFGVDPWADLESI